MNKIYIIIILLLIITNIAFLISFIKHKNLLKYTKYFIKDIISNNSNLYFNHLIKHNLINKIPNIYLSNKSPLLWPNYSKEIYSYYN